MNGYEAIAILREELSEEDVEKGIEEIKSKVTDLGGEIQGTSRMGRKVFARPMKGCTAGEYAMLRFKLESDHVAKLHESLKHSSFLFRMQVVNV